MGRFKWKLLDHGLGGTLECFVDGNKVAEASGSGGRYSVSVAMDFVYRTQQPTGLVRIGEVFVDSDEIDKAVEFFLVNGSWLASVRVEAGDPYPQTGYGEALGQFFEDFEF